MTSTAVSERASVPGLIGWMLSIPEIWHPSSMTTFSSTRASDSGAANLELCGVLLAVVASLLVFMV